MADKYLEQYKNLLDVCKRESNIKILVACSSYPGLRALYFDIGRDLNEQELLIDGDCVKHEKLVLKNGSVVEFYRIKFLDDAYKLAGREYQYIEEVGYIDKKASDYIKCLKCTYIGIDKVEPRQPCDRVSHQREIFSTNNISPLIGASTFVPDGVLSDMSLLEVYERCADASIYSEELGRRLRGITAIVEIEGMIEGDIRKRLEDYTKGCITQREHDKKHGYIEGEDD